MDEWIPLTHCVSTSRGCVGFWGILVRIVLLDDSWWGTRSSEDSYIPGGEHHGHCPRAMARGFERSVLDGPSTHSIIERLKSRTESTDGSYTVPGNLTG